MTKARGLSFGSREAKDVIARVGIRGKIQNNNHQRHATAQGVSHATAKHLARFRGLRVLHALSFAPQPNRSVKGTPTSSITLRLCQARRPLPLALTLSNNPADLVLSRSTLDNLTIKWMVQAGGANGTTQDSQAGVDVAGGRF
jgi:hypothetical protein